MQETVLLYNIDKTDAGKAIISILEKLNVEVIIVKSSDLMINKLICYYKFLKKQTFLSFR